MSTIFKKFLQIKAIPKLLLFWIFSGVILVGGICHAEELEPGHDSLPTWLDQQDWAKRRVWDMFQFRGLYFVNQHTFERLQKTVFREYIKNDKISNPDFPKNDQVLLIMELAHEVLDRELNQPIGPSFQCRPHTYSDGATHLDCW